MIRSSRSRLLPLALLALATLAPQARAGFNAMVVETNAQQPGGLYLYTYVVLNTGGTGATPISEFDLGVNDPIGLTMISSPSDFINFYSPGDASISFIATDAGIAAGSAGVFSFESASAPGLVADQALGYDANFNQSSIQGFITGAAVVPEPSSLLMLGLGSAGVLGLLARSRGRRPAAA